MHGNVPTNVSTVFRRNVAYLTFFLGSESRKLSRKHHFQTHWRVTPPNSKGHALGHTSKLRDTRRSTPEILLVTPPKFTGHAPKIYRPHAPKIYRSHAPKLPCQTRKLLVARLCRSVRCDSVSAIPTLWSTTAKRTCIRPNRGGPSITPIFSVSCFELCGFPQFFNVFVVFFFSECNCSNKEQESA